MTIASALQALQGDVTSAEAQIVSAGGNLDAGTGTSHLRENIATIPAGGQTPTGDATLTAYDRTTGVLTGENLGTSGTVYLLDRDTHTYVAQPTSAWSKTSITLTTPLDLENLEGCTSIGIEYADGTWSTKLLVEGDVEVEGWGIVYIQDTDTGVITKLPITREADFNKLKTSGQYSFARLISFSNGNFYSDEVVGVQIGKDMSQTDVGDVFLRAFFNLDQPLQMKGVVSAGVLASCDKFNQPIDFPDLEIIQNSWMNPARSFNQPVNFQKVVSIGSFFMDGGLAFNFDLDFPKLASVGSYYMRSCYKFNRHINAPLLKTIGNGFLYDARSYNQELNFPALENIANEFLKNASNFDSNINFPELISIGASFLAGTALTDHTINIPKIETIGNYFLDGASLRSQINLFSVKHIGSYFMRSMGAYNKKIIVPSSVMDIGKYFCYDLHGLTNLEVNTDASPTDNYSLSSNKDTEKIYLKGVTITGTGADTWITNLPNITSNPYRKLINGNV